VSTHHSHHCFYLGEEENNENPITFKCCMLTNKLSRRFITLEVLFFSPTTPPRQATQAIRQGQNLHPSLAFTINHHRPSYYYLSQSRPASTSPSLSPIGPFLRTSQCKHYEVPAHSLHFNPTRASDFCQ
jgi:hypothetical protein